MAAFTTIAAGAATAAGAGMSFAQASKQAKLQRKAESAAEKYVAEAKRQAELNPFDALAIQTEPYELAREASLQSAANITQGAREGDQRGVASTAGAIQGQLQGQQAQMRSQMGQDLMSLEQLSAAQEAQNAATLGNIALGQATGAQVAAAQAEEQKNKALQSGVQTLGTGAMFAANQSQLYGGDKSSRLAKKISDDVAAGNISLEDLSIAMGVPAGDLSGLNELQLMDMITRKGLSLDQLKSLNRGEYEGIYSDMTKLQSQYLNPFSF